jgi:hypothetical protein
MSHWCPALFLIFKFWDSVSLCTAQARTWGPPSSASQVFEITGVCHYAQLGSHLKKWNHQKAQKCKECSIKGITCI